jgi:GDPmannose 4,6-dehydratase
MWRILQQDKPDDFVIGTGETHSVREFLHEAFAYAGLDTEKHVKIDPKYFRPSEVDVLIGNADKAGKVLGWKPRVKFMDLVKIVIDADLRQLVLKFPASVTQLLQRNSLRSGGKGTKGPGRML